MSTAIRALILVAILAPSAIADDDPESARREALRQWIHALLADADARTSLLADDRTAGYDGRFFVQTADGNFRVEFSTQFQFRYTYNHREDSGDDDSRGGFQVRRLKPAWQGHLFDPSFEYKVSISLGGSSPDADLSDAYVVKNFDDGISIKSGQFKPPFLYEELMSSKRQLVVDRSIVNDFRGWNQDRSIGVQVAYDAERWRWKAMVHQGFNEDDTPALQEDTEYAAAARAEWLAAGSWRQFRDLASWPGEEFAALLGAAVNIERDESGTPAGPEQQRLSWTVDGGVERDGASLYAAIIGQHVEADGTDDLDHHGVVVQGGLFVTDDLQVVARYEWGDLDLPGVPDAGIVTIGVNRFFNRHDLKLSADIGYGLDEVAAEWENANSGWLADGDGEDGQIVVRIQLQMVF